MLAQETLCNREEQRQQRLLKLKDAMDRQPTNCKELNG